MTRRKPRTPTAVNPVDPRNADDRVIDTAFDIQVRELTKARKWAELEAAFLMHESVLMRREERWTKKTQSK
jgi:hypothetical protein